MTRPLGSSSPEPVKRVCHHEKSITQTHPEGTSRNTGLVLSSHQKQGQRDTLSSHKKQGESEQMSQSGGASAELVTLGNVASGMGSRAEKGHQGKTKETHISRLQSATVCQWLLINCDNCIIAT